MPKKVAVIPQEFTIDAGELTPTLKIKRRVVEDHYRDLIEGDVRGSRARRRSPFRHEREEVVLAVPEEGHPELVVGHAGHEVRLPLAAHPARPERRGGGLQVVTR